MIGKSLHTLIIGMNVVNLGILLVYLNNNWKHKFEFTMPFFLVQNESKFPMQALIHTTPLIFWMNVPISELQ